MTNNRPMKEALNMVPIPWTPLAMTLWSLGCDYYDDNERCWNTYTPELLAQYSKKLGRPVTLKNAMSLGLKPQTTWFFKDSEKLRKLMAAYENGRKRTPGASTFDDVPDEAYAHMAAVIFANRSVEMETIKNSPPKLKIKVGNDWKFVGKDATPETLTKLGIK